MYTEDNITEKLNTSRPTLSQADQDALFANIAKEIGASKPVVSPYYSLFIQKKFLAPVALVLLLVISTTSVVAVAEAAKPGDTLFTVDQTVESIRLALASEDNKVRLEAEFAAERLLELATSLEESLKESRASSTPNNDNTKINETLGFTISYLAKSNLSSSTKESLYTEIAELLEGAPVRIDDKKLRVYDTDSRIEIKEDNDDRRVEVRDGENRLRIREKDGELRVEYKGNWDDDDDDDDRNTERDDNDDEDRDDDNRSKSNSSINNGITNPVNQLRPTIISPSSDDRDRDSDDDNEDREERGRDDDDEEDRSDDDEDKRNDDSSNDDNDSTVDEDDITGDRSNDETESDSGSSRIKVEVEVEDGVAEVKIDSDSNDNEFTLPYTTKALLITAIAQKTGLSEVTVSSNLDIEYKD